MTVVNLKNLLSRVRTERGPIRLENQKPMESGKQSAVVDLGETLANDASHPTWITMNTPLGVIISNNFLTMGIANRILRALNLLESDFIRLRGRKCIPLGGRVTPQGLIPKDDIPEWLKRVMKNVHELSLQSLGLPPPNHALVNVYDPGEGIMAHEDGPAYTPYAAILSLGSGSVFDFVSKTVPRVSTGQIYLPVGSLMLFHSAAYEDVLHEFRFTKFDPLDEAVFNHEAVETHPERLGESILCGDVLTRGRRISITMRHVPTYTS